MKYEKVCFYSKKKLMKRNEIGFINKGYIAYHNEKTPDGYSIISGSQAAVSLFPFRFRCCIRSVGLSSAAALWVCRLRLCRRGGDKIKKYSFSRVLAVRQVRQNAATVRPIWHKKRGLPLVGSPLFVAAQFCAQSA